MEYNGGATYTLLEEDNQQNVKATKNLDKFFTSMYQYYVSKGIGVVALSQFCAVTSLGFTIGFSVFLFAFVNWNALLQCHDEQTCQDINIALVTNPFDQTPTMFLFFIFMYTIVFSGLLVYMCFSAVNEISDALEMSTFYRETLGLSLQDLEHIQWFEVVQRVTELHAHGSYKVVEKEELTVHDVALRIMRKENYLIGLINKNTLDLFVPWWLSPLAGEQLFLNKSLEWSLTFCIMEYMFNDDYDISAEFLGDVAGLQLRFQVVGLIHFLLLPFMLIFMVVHFFLQNASQFHSSKAYLGPRKWSPFALWKFREFNELPHLFEERINRSYGPANEYIETFHSPYTTVLARWATYIAGSFVAALLLVSVLSDGALLYVHVADYNLLWYLGVFSACYAGARSQIPDDTKVRASAGQLLQQTCGHTHYFPPHWEQLAHTTEVRDEVCSIFQYKGQIFLMEVLSVVLTPVVLYFSLPSCAQAVLDFVRYWTLFLLF
jgi:autophagy-related protein 9